MPSSSSTAAEQPTREAQTAEKPTATGASPASDYDEWEMEERLRHLDRLYARNPLSGPMSRSGSPQFRIDSVHGPGPRNQSAPIRSATARPSHLARLGRLGLGMGLAVTVCGASLMAWAHFGPRPDLWATGIPIAVVGQVLLLIGLVFQLDASGSESRPKATPARDVGHPLSTGDATLRIDDGPDASPQLNDLAARLDELSRRVEGEPE